MCKHVIAEGLDQKLFKVPSEMSLQSILRTRMAGVGRSLKKRGGKGRPEWVLWSDEGTSDEMSGEEHVTHRANNLESGSDDDIPSGSSELDDELESEQSEGREPEPSARQKQHADRAPRAKKSNKKAKKQKGGSCSCRRLSSADGFTVSKVAGSVPGG